MEAFRSVDPVQSYGRLFLTRFPSKLPEFLASAFEGGLMYSLVYEPHDATAWQCHVPKHAGFGIMHRPTNAVVGLFAGFPGESSHVCPQTKEARLATR